MHQPKPHVILIAYIFRPSTEMGAIRPSRFRKNLQRMGYACHTITATPQGDNPADDIIVVPDDLRARWEGTERTPLSLKGYLELLIRHVMYPGHLGFIWSKGAAAECLKLFRKYPNDRFVVLSTYPPMGTLVAGLMVRLRKRVPWIADFRDPIFGRLRYMRGFFAIIDLISIQKRLLSFEATLHGNPLPSIESEAEPQSS